MKTAVVDVGGGLRGIYASGVLDRCMEDGVRFDAGIGVSAGSANVASYIAGQKGRNYKFYTEYSSRREYMSLHNFLVKKSYIDMDYLYGKLSNSDGEYPLDYAAIAKSPVAFLAVDTDADTGKVKYFDKNDMKPDNYDILKASCSIPFVCRPYSIEGVPYYDGALSDPVPVEKAFSMGCDRVVLILTKPREVRRTPEKDRILASRIRKKYPLAAAQLERRAEKYNIETKILSGKDGNKMSDLGTEVKKIFLAGIGAIATTAEKSAEIVDGLVKKGELTVEQGKILNEELKRDVSDKVKKAASNIQGKESVEKIADRVGEMTAEERALLLKKLEEAESAEKKEQEGSAAEEAGERSDSEKKDDRKENADDSGEN